MTTQHDRREPAVSLSPLRFTALIVWSFARTRWLQRFRTRARVESTQQRRVTRHMNKLATTSPYVREVLEQAGGDFHKIPLMDKTIMMERFDDLNTVGINRDEALDVAIAAERNRDFSTELHGCSVGLSSGTSGHRGLFVVSPQERAQWAGTILARSLPPGKLRGHRIALFLRADNDLYQTIGSRAVTFEYFDVYAPMAKNLDRLAEYQPTILVAPPSVLRDIAHAQDEGHLTVTPQKVMSVAEVLERTDEQFLTQTFHVPIIHQIYQATEGFLAHTCEQGTLHLNEDTVLVEREVVEGRRFIPIITDFRRTTQPILRYRLNDILLEREAPCPCGSVLTAIERIEGRESDTFLIPTTSGTLQPVYGDMVSRSMLYATGFSDYRIVQTNPAEFTIYLDTPTPQAQESVIEELTALIAPFQGVMPVVNFQPYSRDTSQKLRRIERTFTP